MKIEPIYVTFEQAKLLASKEFLVHTRYGYTKGGVLERPHYGETYINSDFENSLTYSAPEQWVVKEWLRIVHGIWVEVNFSVKHENFYFTLCATKRGVLICYATDKSKIGYETPQEAYSEGISHVLNNLI